MKPIHLAIIAIVILIIILIIVMEFPIYYGHSAIVIGSGLPQKTTVGNNVTISRTIFPHALPTLTEIGLLFNGTQSYDNTSFYVKQGQNVTLVVNVTSDPTNLPMTLYAEPHIGFTSTNGLDFKFSSTHVTTPGIVLLHILVGSDATPNAYRTRVFATTGGEPNGMSLGADIGITVTPQNNDTKKLHSTSIFDIGITHMSDNVTGTNFTVNYNINGGQVLGIKQDAQSKSLIVSVKTTDEGQLVIDMPRKLIDAILPNGHDDKYYVLVGGQESDFKEINTTTTHRTLLIPFSQGANTIEIIGTNPLW